MPAKHPAYAQCFSPVFSQGAGFLKLAYTRWEPVVPNTSNAKPLICMHGLSRNGRDFDFVAQHLAEFLQFTVYCPDMIGRGKSDWVEEKYLTLYDNASYFQHLLQFVGRITTSCEPIDYLGTSMGGILGMLLASCPNTPVKRLIINDVGAIVKRKAIERIKMGMQADPVFDTYEDAMAYVKERYKTFGLETAEQWQKMTDNSMVQTQEGKFKFHYDPNIKKNYAVPDNDISLWQFWDAITCPVLLLRGKNSDILDVETVEQMKLRGPKNFTVVELDNVGHAPMLFKPAEIKIIRDWLEQTEEKK